MHEETVTMSSWGSPWATENLLEEAEWPPSGLRGGASSKGSGLWWEAEPILPSGAKSVLQT